MVAMMGISLVVAAEVWQTAQKRDKEEELLFVGDQFRRALALHYQDTSAYPRSLEDLLRDPGFPGVRRHLRKLYRDPVTGSAQWGLVKSVGEAIVGVHSLSDAQPFKKAGFSAADQGFEGKTKYSEWVFSPTNVQGAPGANAPAASAPSAAAPRQPGTTQSRVRR
ncbi:MAG: type II secretion system protein [Betaproteobacteria bacterium]|nr:type II secretion system protein [Betaproteobacteria bacterium]